MGALESLVYFPQMAPNIMVQNCSPSECFGAIPHPPVLHIHEEKPKDQMQQPRPQCPTRHPQSGALRTLPPGLFGSTADNTTARPPTLLGASDLPSRGFFWRQTLRSPCEWSPLSSRGPYATNTFSPRVNRANIVHPFYGEENRGVGQ